MFSGLNNVVPHIRTSFLFKAGSYSAVSHTSSCLSICWWSWDRFHSLATVNHEHLCKLGYLNSFQFFRVSTRAGNLRLTPREAAEHFPQWLNGFNYSHRQWIPIFSHPNTWYFPFYYSHLSELKRYLNVDLMCISLITSDTGHLFTCACWPFVDLPWRNVYSGPWSIFLVFGLFVDSYKSSLYILNI